MNRSRRSATSRTFTRSGVRLGAGGSLTAHLASRLCPRLGSGASGIQRDAPAHPGGPRVEPKDPDQPWMMLIQVLPTGTDFDRSPPWTIAPLAGQPPRPLRAAPARDRQCRSGCFSTAGRSAWSMPRAVETSGYMTFHLADMAKVAGRPIFAALHMLLSRPPLQHGREAAASRHPGRQPQVPERRLDAACRAGPGSPLRIGPRLPGGRRPAQGANLLPRRASRRPQPRLRRPAHRAHAAGLRPVRRGPQPAFHRSGLRQLLLGHRASSSGCAPTRAAIPTRWTSVWGLGATADALPPDLRGRAARRPAHSGRARAICSIPTATLSSKAGRTRAPSGDKLAIPHVSDGVVYRVLQNLLILDGERLSYRTLDVEQIGSVYETVMGFNLAGRRGPVHRHQADQVARRPGHDQPGSPAGRQAGRQRQKWLADKPIRS